MSSMLKRSLCLVALTLLVATGLASQRSARAAVGPPQPGEAPVEAQLFSGDWTTVVDSQATFGSAVVINSGAISTATTTTPESYLLNVRLRSAGARVALTMDGQQVGTTVVYGGTWRTVSVPVRVVNGTPTWAIKPLPGVGYTPQPVYVDWLSLASAPSGLTAAGNKIIGADGAPVVPRGVNRNGYEYTPTGSARMGDSDYEAMRLWGATMVRLPLGQQYWLPSMCAYDPQFASRVDQAVNSITGRGMIALLDLHTTYGGLTCGHSGLAAMPDQYSVQFWTEVANRYKSNPLVAFDLFNEPHDVSEAVWHDGGWTGAYQSVGMQKLYDTVRATGATNLTFVSGYGWAFHIDVALRRPIDGYGIVYATHVYNPPETGPLRSEVDNVIPPVAAQYPVVMTEFGTSSGTALYNQNAIAYAENLGIGWTAWLWSQQPSQFALLQDFVSYQPSPAGLPVRDALWKAKGWTTYGG